MDPLTLVIIGLIGFWVLGFFLRIGGAIIHLALLIALAAIAAKFLHLI